MREIVCEVTVGVGVRRGTVEILLFVLTCREFSPLP